MNFIDVTADEGVNSADFPAPLMPRPSRLPHGWRGVMGIRPEHIVVDDNGQKLRLKAVEQLGGVTYGYAVLDSGAEMCVDLGDRRGLKAGDEVGIAFPEERTHFFDKETEKRLG